MRAPVEISRASLRVVAAALVAVGTAGCSADVTRFDENPFASPYASKNSPSSEVTGAAPPTQSAPSGRIDSQPLPQTQSYQPLPPPPSRQSALSPSPGTSGGSSGIASYSPTPASSDVTGAVRPAASHWDWDGGTGITVAPGETVDVLARRYGVPASAIMQANGLTTASVLQPGQRVVIPRYNNASVAAVGAPANRPLRPAAPTIVAGGAPSAIRAPGPRIPQSAGVHVVQPHETLTSISRRYGKTVTEVATANHIPPYTRVKMGDRITIPGTSTTGALPKQQVASVVAAPRIAAPTQKVVRAEPPPRAQVVTPEAREAEAVVPTPSSGTPSFGWPARGRVIAGFGEKLPSGQLNDGINLAVPEGTAVRAAEDGVVAYAGSELRGYGNLILVRHPNGFVTAYAHTSEILVKRNDPVKRGQVIARSGATGAVTTPQLHFETRKGSAPVNPMQYLPAGA